MKKVGKECLRVVFYFLAFGILGFVVETLTIRLTTGTWMARGYWFTPGHYPLAGFKYIGMPLIPLYGFGGLLAVYAVRPLRKHPILVFLVGMVALTALEFVVGYLLLEVDNVRLWSYPPGLAYAWGILDVWTTVAWGALAVGLVYIVIPPLEKLFSRLVKRRWAQILLIVLLVLVLLCSLHRDVGFLAGAQGFEPRNAGTRTQCLTAWRRPNS